MTTEGHNYLGGVIGSNRYNEVYANILVNDWVKQIMVLSEIAKSEPQNQKQQEADSFKISANMPYYMLQKN